MIKFHRSHGSGLFGARFRYLSERNKASKGFIEKANDVGTAQNGAYIKPAKHGESQYGKKVESQ